MRTVDAAVIVVAVRNESQAKTAGAAQREVEMPDQPLDGESREQGPRGSHAPSPAPGRDLEGAPAARACGSCEVAKEVAADKARLAVWLAHELRTPLNCVLGYAELLCDQLAGSGRSSLVTDAERVRDLALHQLSLLDDVLDLAKLEHGSVPLRTEPVDAIRVLGAVAEAAFPLVRRGGNRLCLAVDGEGWVFADETRLRQVLLNLVGNAAKFTHDGLVALGATARDGSVSLHVRDTGCGMTAAEAERVYRPFHQANAAVSAAHGGSGLGLAISKELCERMGGSISLQSAVGEGTTFTVTLPAAPRPRPAAG
jgi:signal transduction histidine kinase